MISAFLRDPKSHVASGLQDLQLGLDNLRVHKLRSLLTMLGIVIGVGAVIAMDGIGRGAQTQIKSRITALGTNPTS